MSCQDFWKVVMSQLYSDQAQPHPSKALNAKIPAGLLQKYGEWLLGHVWANQSEQK